MNFRVAQILNTVAVALLLGNMLGWPWVPGMLPVAAAILLLLATGLLALVHSFIVPIQIAMKEANREQSEQEAQDRERIRNP